MSNIGAVIEVIAQHGDDVAVVVDKLGGVANLVRLAPTLVHLAMVVAEHANDPSPEATAARIQKTLAYSAETRKRVVEFQKEHGLTADGIVGNRTWSKVEELLK